MARPVSPKSDEAALDAPPPEETKVFLSYSRKDAAALERIAEALITHPEFQPDFDKAEHDPDKVGAGISADEPWWQRLEQMIAGAEAMVFLVSPHSAASKVCDEEIAYAQRLGKRIIPVLAGAVDFTKLPPKLNSLNIAIDFTDSGPGFDASLAHLIRVLSVNAAWLREGRRYTERAAEWERKGRPKGSLLPTGAFEEAESWAARRPKNEPEPGELFSAWIAASRLYIQEQIARERRQLRRAQIWQSAAGFILVLGFSALAAGAWFVAQGQRAVGLSYSKVLTSASSEADSPGEFGWRLLSDGGARAVKLALVAYSESALGPVAIDADFRLGSALSQSQLSIVLEGHGNWVFSAAFSPDGTRIVTASDDYTARVWREGEDGAWTSAVLEGHEEDSVFSAAFSPDGSRIVTASEDQTARVWSRGENGEWTSSILRGHERGVYSATFSPDGKRIVTASGDDTARVWSEVEDGVWTSTALEGHADWVNSATFSPDGTSIVTASSDETARVWREAEDGAWTSTALEGHSGGVNSATFSPDGTLIVTASDDATARVWGQNWEGTWISTPLSGHSQPVTTAAFSPDGTRIVTASQDQTARTWLVVGEGALTSTILEGHQSSINSAAFSPDGTQIITASNDYSIRVWRTHEDGPWSTKALEGHSDAVWSATFSADGHRIVTASKDTTARVWRLGEDKNWAGTALEGHADAVTSAAFSPDGTRIVTSSLDTTARIWRENGNFAWTDFILKGHEGALYSATFSPDGTRIVTASADSTARVWSRGENGAWTSSALEGHDNDVLSAAFSPDGSSIVTASADNTVRVWKQEDGAWTSTVLQGDEDFLYSAVFSADGSRIRTTSTDGTVRFWRQKDEGLWISGLPIEMSVKDVLSLSPGGNLLVTSSVPDLAFIYREGEDGEWSLTDLDGHTSNVTAAAFSPDGTRIVTGSGDNTARVWAIDLLVSDPERDRTNRKSGVVNQPPLKPLACDRLRAASAVWVQDTTGREPRLKHFYTELTNEDLRTTPLLRIMGYKTGDDVCKASKPKGIDALLTRWLPRKWWSRLDWSD